MQSCRRGLFSEVLKICIIIFVPQGKLEKDSNDQQEEVTVLKGEEIPDNVFRAQIALVTPVSTLYSIYCNLSADNFQ